MAPRLCTGVHSDLSRIWIRSRSFGCRKSARYLSSSVPMRYPSNVLFDQRLIMDHPRRSSSASSSDTISHRIGSCSPKARTTAAPESLRIHPSQLDRTTHQVRQRKGVPTKLQIFKPTYSSSSTSHVASPTTAAQSPSSSSSQKVQLRGRPERFYVSSSDRTYDFSDTQSSAGRESASSRPLKPPLSVLPKPSPPPPLQINSSNAAESKRLGAGQFQLFNRSGSSLSTLSSLADTPESSSGPFQDVSQSTIPHRSSVVTFSSGTPPIEYQLLRPLPVSRIGKKNNNSSDHLPPKTKRRPFDNIPLGKGESQKETDDQTDSERQSELTRLRSEWQGTHLDASSSLENLPSVDGSIEMAHAGLYIQALRDQQTDLLNRFNENRELVLRALNELQNFSTHDGLSETSQNEPSEDSAAILAPEPIRKLWLAKNEKDVRAVMKFVQTTYQSGKIPVLPTFYEDLSVACKRLELYHLLGEVVIFSDDYGLEPPPAKYLSSIRGLLKHLIDQEAFILSSRSTLTPTTAELSGADFPSSSHSQDPPSESSSLRLTIPLLDRLFIQLPFDPVLCALSLQALSLLTSTSSNASLRFASLQESLLTSEIPSSWTVRTGKQTWWSGLSPGEIKLHSRWLLEALDSIRSFIPPELASLWKAGIPSPGLDLHRARLREVFLLVDQAKPEPYSITLDWLENNVDNDSDNSTKDKINNSHHQFSYRENATTVLGLPKTLPLVPRLIESFLDSPLASHHSDPVIVLFSLGIRMKMIPDESALREIHWTVKNLPKLAKSWDKVFASNSLQTEGTYWISKRDRTVAEACLKMVEELLNERVGLWRNGLSLRKDGAEKSIS